MIKTLFKGGGGEMNTSSYIPRSILKTLKKCDDIFN